MDEPGSHRVVFAHPFTLPGVEGVHPPGSYEVVVDREALDVPFPSYLVSMRIMIPSRGGIEAWPVAPADLEAALAADRLVKPHS